MLPYAPKTLTDIEHGSQSALMTALAGLAGVWLMQAGSTLHFYKEIAASNAFGMTPEKGVQLACALDVLHILDRTPEGRKAILDLLGKPVFQETESEG